ncbi:hypothetical protein RUM43_011536 [Polyplax serrata]|uniref:Uncharacterized protein n=1 Tax=Polyplax serrata TaxID=468196 RepID=A0AAN8NYC2_POLSC
MGSQAGQRNVLTSGPPPKEFLPNLHRTVLPICFASNYTERSSEQNMFRCMAFHPNWELFGTSGTAPNHRDFLAYQDESAHSRMCGAQGGARTCGSVTKA